MIENYIDQWGRVHHKRTSRYIKDPKKHSGAFGNGWIYTAYAKYFYPEAVDMDKLKKTYDKCLKDKHPLRVNRSPKYSREPMSKDEIIGMVSLGLLDNKTLRKSHYNFCNLRGNFDRRLTPMNIAKATVLLHGIKDKDRKYAWQKKMVDTYCLLFALPPWDIYYVKKMHGVKPTREERLAFCSNKRAVLKGNNGSTQMLLWLQLKDMGMSVKEIDLKKALKHDFRSTHPFYERV